MFKFDLTAVEAARSAGAECGFDAFMSSTFVPNPNDPSSPLFEAWADGYEIGVIEAKKVSGLLAANDN